MINNCQCTGCGVIISADSSRTSDVQCAACSAILGAAAPTTSQGFNGAPVMMEYQCPGCGAYIAADPRITPDVQCNSCSTIIKLGQDLPSDVPNIPSPPPPGMEDKYPPLPVPAPGLGNLISVGEPDKNGGKLAWKSFLLQPRVLAIGLVLAPVMITVIIGAILTLIRSGIGIASGGGDPMLQGGSIVLGILSLWSMYILGTTFFYADRDWVTDFGLGIVVLGGCWGMYSVITAFPPSLLAMLWHFYLGYIALCASILAIWLMAPYKGIGSVRYNETR